MLKSGLPLREMATFSPALLTYLQDELSVTTAEEFLGLAQSAGPVLEKAIGEALPPLVEAVREALPPEQMRAIEEAASGDYPFRTGHQAPE